MIALLAACLFFEILSLCTCLFASAKARAKTVFGHLKNDFELTRFAFELLQKFEAVPHEWKSFPNSSDTIEI